MFNQEAIRKFWSLVAVKNPDDCWLWMAGKKSKGYGQVCLDGMSMPAHRAAVQIHTGKIIPTGLIVLHSCDTPSCVNPAHLSLGTDSDNMADKLAKNRQARNYGELAGNNKQTKEKVRQLLWDRVAGMSFTRLGDKYILDKKTVRMICEGDSWPHMPGSDGCPTLSQLLLVPKETRGGAELTTDQVRTIMKKLADGEPAKPIAREYNVHFVTISDIKLGRAWASLTGKDGNPTIEQMKYAKPLCKHTAKLTEGMANEAKKRLSDGQSARYIAKLLGVTVGAIYHIKQGRTWKNVPDA